jgi:hypothetical protein
VRNPKDAEPPAGIVPDQGKKDVVAHAAVVSNKVIDNAAARGSAAQGRNIRAELVQFVNYFFLQPEIQVPEIGDRVTDEA